MIETKIRILGIAPYDGMHTIMENAAQAYPNIQLDIHTGDLEEGQAIVAQMPTNTYDCIISRGGTATLIRKITDLPVIEIQISVYDVLRAIKLAENYSRRYAIVGFPNVTEPAHTLCSLLGLKLDIHTVHSAEEANITLTKLQQEDYHMVVCDMVTHTLARQLGMDAFLINSGIESLQTALDQAVNISTWFARLRQETLLLRSITQGTERPRHCAGAGRQPFLQQCAGSLCSPLSGDALPSLGNSRKRKPALLLHRIRSAIQHHCPADSSEQHEALSVLLPSRPDSSACEPHRNSLVESG